MPIDRCGFSSWRDRKKSPRPGGTCGERGEEPPARLDAVPAAGSARRGAGVRERERERVGASSRPYREPLGRGSAAALSGSAGDALPPARRGGCAAPAPPLTPPRPSPAPPLLRFSGLGTQISLPNIPTGAIQQKLSLYQDSSNTSQGKPDVK